MSPILVGLSVLCISDPLPPPVPLLHVRYHLQVILFHPSLYLQRCHRCLLKSIFSLSVDFFIHYSKAFFKILEFLLQGVSIHFSFQYHLNHEQWPMCTFSRSSCLTFVTCQITLLRKKSFAFSYRYLSYLCPLCIPTNSSICV